MGKRVNRYRALEDQMAKTLGVSLGLFIIYLIAAGIGIGWLKGICAVLTILGGTGCFSYLYLAGEWKKRRSLWMTVWAAALVICTIFSLILQFPSPHPAR